MDETGAPSSSRVVSVPLSKPIIETRTAAPSKVHSRLLHAKKMDPSTMIRSRTIRLDPARIAWVARRPTLDAFDCTSAKDLLNQ